MKEFYTKPELYFDDLASIVDKYLTLESSTNGVDKIIDHTLDGDKSILNLSELNEWGNEVKDPEYDVLISDLTYFPDSAKITFSESETSSSFFMNMDSVDYFVAAEGENLPNYENQTFKFGIDPEVSGFTLKLASKWNSTDITLTEAGAIITDLAEIFIPDRNKIYTLNEKISGVIRSAGLVYNTVFYTYKEVELSSLSFDTIHDAVTYIKPRAGEKDLKLTYNISTLAISVEGADDLEDLTVKKAKTDSIRIDVTSTIYGNIILTGVLSTYTMDNETISGKVLNLLLIAAPADDYEYSKSVAYLWNINTYNRYTRTYENGAWSNWENLSMEILYRSTGSPVATYTENGSHVIEASTGKAYASLNVLVDVQS